MAHFQRNRMMVRFLQIATLLSTGHASLIRDNKVNVYLTETNESNSNQTEEIEVCNEQRENHVGGSQTVTIGEECDQIEIGDVNGTIKTFPLALCCLLLLLMLALVTLSIFLKFNTTFKWSLTIISLMMLLIVPVFLCSKNN